MTDTDLLLEVIRGSGLRLGYIAEKLGITYYSLHKKIYNVTQFKATEIQTVSELLKLSVEQREKIFFAVKVDYKSTM